MGLPELTDIDGLARSRDGRILATVSQYTVSLWDATSGQNLLVLQNGDNESIFAPAFSRDGSLLATVSTAQRYKIEGHLLLWNPATGERLGSIDNLSYPGCASFNPAGTLIAVGGNTLYLVDPSTKEIVNQRAGSSSLSGRATFRGPAWIQERLTIPSNPRFSSASIGERNDRWLPEWLRQPTREPRSSYPNSP